MASPSTSLRKSGGQSHSDLLDLSHRALQLSFQRLTAGDYRQAADNVRKSVNLATEAIAEQRGWQHDSKAMRSGVISQVSVETGSTTASADALHIGWSAGNAIPDDGSNLAIYDDIIRHSLTAGEAFVQVIEQLMKEPPKPFTIARRLDAHRIAQLTGYEPPIGATDVLGFANFTGVVREE